MRNGRGVSSSRAHGASWYKTSNVPSMTRYGLIDNSPIETKRD